VRGVDTSLDNEAVRVVSTFPKFKPGKQQGVPVPVWFSLPVLFRLQNN
jgi:protein TonB